MFHAAILVAAVVTAVVLIIWPGWAQRSAVGGLRGQRFLDTEANQWFRGTFARWLERVPEWAVRAWGVVVLALGLLESVLTR
jgi:hypothetical protein